MTDETIVVLEVPETLVVSEGEQGPTGSQGLDGFGVVQVDSQHQPPPVAQVIDSIQSGIYRSVKWIVTVSNLVTSQHKVSEILALQKGTSVDHSSFNIIGDNIDYDLNVNLSGTALQLLMTNNTNTDLDVRVLRIPTLI